MELLLIIAAMAVIPASIASNKGRSFGKWYAYGFVVFLPALIHSLYLGDLSDTKECKHCTKKIPTKATRCMHCTGKFDKLYPMHN